jgi:ATP-binding cassette subfamily B protein
VSGPAGRPSPNGQRPETSSADRGGQPAGRFRPGRAPAGRWRLHGHGRHAHRQATNFRKSFRRLLGELRPERTWVLIVVLFAIVSVTLAVIGPKLLGNATNIIFEGVVSKQFPPGLSMDQVIALLRAQGQDNLANMLSAMNVVPGAGIDFTALTSALLVVAVILHLQLGLLVGAGLHHGRRHTAHRLPLARTGRSEDRPAAAGLLRP